MRDILIRLTSAFGDLRSMVDEGILAYPYSTRELVQVVKHLNEFPEDPIGLVLENVLSFDSFSIELQNTLHGVFTKHGIPLHGDRTQIQNRVVLAKTISLKPPVEESKWYTESSQEYSIELQCLPMEEFRPPDHQKADLSIPSKVEWKNVESQLSTR
jgi:hypothetical protein